MVRFYRPPFDKQLTGSVCGHANCNMCAAGRFANRLSLGLVNRTGDQMRALSGTQGTCADRVAGNEGTNLANAATALAAVGIHVNVEPDLTALDVFGTLDAGGFGFVLGDYDRVPDALKGDHEFFGFHSVYLNEHDRINKRTLVWDSLDDGRPDLPTRRIAPQGPLWWPDWVLTAYMAAWPGVPVAAVLGRGRLLRAGVSVSNVRAGATRASGIVSRLRLGMTLVYGGTVTGERIGGDARWYRVWVPSLARIGYMHASVVRV